MLHDDLRSASRRSHRTFGARALTGIGAAALLGTMLAGNAQAAPVGAGNSADNVLDHPYRHGLVHTVGTNLPGLAGLNNLQYAGGTSGVGVTTGAPRV